MSRSTPRRTQLERAFAHKVDVPTPEGGHGVRLNQMLAWCRAHVADGAWDNYGARFYLAEETAARAFAAAWGGIAIA